MASVTKRIKEVKQPYGGYLSWKEMEQIQFEDSLVLNNPESENISESILEYSVNALTREFLKGGSGEAYKISMMGATMLGNDERNKAVDLFNEVGYLDSKSVYLACKLVGYNCVVRDGGAGFVNIESIQANKATIQNIKRMRKRGLDLFALRGYGTVQKCGFTMDGGYTEVVDNGGGDYLTRDTIWDFKVLKGNPTSKHTL